MYGPADTVKTYALPRRRDRCPAFAEANRRKAVAMAAR
jgi:hypothetical protein